MARDERFHPLIMVCCIKFFTFINEGSRNMFFPCLSLSIWIEIKVILQGIILVIFLVCQSFVISSTENLSYFDAFYACFITYMTIGFGDMDIFVRKLLNVIFKFFIASFMLKIEK